METIGAKWLGYDSVTAEFKMMSFGGFPGVVRTPPKSTHQTMFGELYSMDEQGLSHLDMLESHPNWYERLKFRTNVMDCRAWVYTLPGGEGYLDATRYDAVPEGIWLPKDDELEFWQDNGVEIDLSA
jgi:gamma-glutamylcyclotransferase (GGCT)/AIG2-like uncharacterized protein YtfP